MIGAVLKMLDPQALDYLRLKEALTSSLPGARYSSTSFRNSCLSQFLIGMLKPSLGAIHALSRHVASRDALQ